MTHPTVHTGHPDGICVRCQGHPEGICERCPGHIGHWKLLDFDITVLYWQWFKGEDAFCYQWSSSENTICYHGPQVEIVELGARLQNNVASSACASFLNGFASRPIAYFSTKQIRVIGLSRHRVSRQ